MVGNAGASIIAGLVKGQVALPALSSWPHHIYQALIEQKSQALIIAPIIIIAGSWLYFSLGEEPSLLLTMGLLAVAIAFLTVRRNSLFFFVIGLVLVGFCATKFRADVVATPMLAGPTNGVIASGYVSDYHNRAFGRRILIIALEETTGIPEQEVPKQIRIYADDARSLQIGDFISFEAYLAPLPRPAQPGGFDFGRMLYFQSIGAGGRMIGPPVFENRTVPWSYQTRRFFRNLRETISGRITKTIPGPVGHLADSMVSGERSGIPPEMSTSLQISGLAHIISISGLHMSIVAGGTYWALRAMLALIPFLALQFSIKKIAACGALFIGLFYTLLADSGSATERAFLMIAVMFLAILVDRPALSLRNLAIAAILIVLITPEETIGASFQMSFLAVMGLTSFIAWWNSKQAIGALIEQSVTLRLFLKIWRFIMLSTLTTLVAGGTSAIAAVYHFDRLSPYSVLANGLTLPVSEALVMPPAVIAVALMPLGLEYYPLKIMEFGLNFTMVVSDYVAALPSANVLVAKPNIIGILILALAAAIASIALGRLRLAAIPLAVLGLLIANITSSPAILVEDRASSVAIANAESLYVLPPGTKNQFVVSKWLQDNGEIITPLEAEQKPGWDCNSGDCFSQLAPMSVSYLREKSGNGLYCPPTEIIIADFPLQRKCRDARLVIDRIDVWRNGAYAVRFFSGRYSLTTARGEQGNRPWAYDSRKGLGRGQ